VFVPKIFNNEQKFAFMLGVLRSIIKNRRFIQISLVVLISSLLMVSSLEYYDIEKKNQEIRDLELKSVPIINVTKHVNLSYNTVTTSYYQYEGNNMHQYDINATPGNFSDKLNGMIIVDPSYSNGTFYVPLTNMSLCNGGLDAINSTTGNIIWNITFPNEVMTEPLIIGHEVVVGLGNNQFINPDIRGTGINYLAAVNISNGSPIWQFGTCGEDMPTPVFHDGLIIEPTGGGVVYAINASSGNQVWSTCVGSFVSMSSPAIYNGTIYFGGANPYNFYALNASTGKVLWDYCTNATGGLTDGSPVITDGQVIDGYTVELGNETFQAFVISFNASDGNVMWITYEGIGIQPQSPPIEIPPLTADGNLVFSEPTALSKLFAINATNGDILWDKYTGYDDSNPAIVNHDIVTVNLTGSLMVFNSTGSLLLTYSTGVVFGAGTIVVMNGHLILFGTNGVFESLPYARSSVVIR
jgi:outer membrane protein assembly factor BamB